jgi:CBS domain-containing protein
MKGKISVKHKLVSEIMSSPVKVMSPMMSVHEAIVFLIKHQISGAPLVDHEGGLISVVSELDLMKLGALEGTEILLGESTDQLCKKENLITIKPEEAFVKLFKLFLEKNVRRVIVVDEKNKAVGIVARRDIIRAYLDGPNSK